MPGILVQAPCRGSPDDAVRQHSRLRWIEVLQTSQQFSPSMEFGQRIGLFWGCRWNLMRRKPPDRWSSSLWNDPRIGAALAQSRIRPCIQLSPVAKSASCGLRQGVVHRRGRRAVDLRRAVAHERLGQTAAAKVDFPQSRVKIQSTDSVAAKKSPRSALSEVQDRRNAKLLGRVTGQGPERRRCQAHGRG